MEKNKLASRQAVVEILNAVLQKKRPFDSAFIDVIDKKFKDTKLESRDRGFIKLVCITTLRHFGQANYVLNSFLQKPLPKKTVLLKAILISAIAQLLYLKTPAHAAIDTAVELTKTNKMKNYSKLVNGVLRNVERNKNKILQDDKNTAKLNVPNWLYSSWERAYGADFAEKISQINLIEPNIDFSVKNNAKSWASELEGELLPFDSVRKSGSCIVKNLAKYENGEWWVQDIAASIPVKLAGNIKGKKVADLCSAPGGKTCQLINKGAKVTAFDRSEKRIKILKENLERLNFSADVICSDSYKWLKNNEDEKFDMILLDAPCSATGTIRKNPDVLIHKNQDNIYQYANTQKKLLNAAIGALKKGGTLLYCVCSIQPEEGEMQIKKFLSSNQNMEKIPFKTEELNELNAKGLEHIITENGDIRTLPFYLEEQGGMDGFFLSRLIRRK
jgi:16S rRNA (cytosine967-C5)-methyltransferase